MDERNTAVPEGQNAKENPVPTSCPYCGTPLKAKAFANGTTELKCTKPKREGVFIAHSLTFYYKKT